MKVSELVAAKEHRVTFSISELPEEVSGFPNCSAPSADMTTRWQQCYYNVQSSVYIGLQQDLLKRSHH